MSFPPLRPVTVAVTTHLKPRDRIVSTHNDVIGREAVDTIRSRVVVVVVVGLVAVAIVGGKLGNIACEYVTSGKAEEHFTTAKSWVKGLFTSSKRVEAC